MDAHVDVVEAEVEEDPMRMEICRQEIRGTTFRGLLVAEEEGVEEAEDEVEANEERITSRS